jgi:RNA polymerase sigma factor (sigma-70 family)
MHEAEPGVAGSMGAPEQPGTRLAEARALSKPSLAELFAAQESPLLAYAQKIVNNYETAQDIVQEAFTRLHGCYDTVRQPRPWLYRTIHNLAMNHLRSSRRTVSLQSVAEESQQWPDTRLLPDAEIARLEAIGQTRLCLDALDLRSRELVRLKFEEGLSYQQMSQRTQLTVSNVGYLLHHALKNLATELKKLGFIP